MRCWLERQLNTSRDPHLNNHSRVLCSEETSYYGATAPPDYTVLIPLVSFLVCKVNNAITSESWLKSQVCQFRISTFQAQGDSWPNASGPAGFRVCRPHQHYELQVLRALGTKPLNE